MFPNRSYYQSGGAHNDGHLTGIYSLSRCCDPDLLSICDGKQSNLMYRHGFPSTATAAEIPPSPCEDFIQYSNNNSIPKDSMSSLYTGMGHSLSSQSRTYSDKIDQNLETDYFSRRIMSSRIQSFHNHSQPQAICTQMAYHNGSDQPYLQSIENVATEHPLLSHPEFGICFPPQSSFNNGTKVANMAAEQYPVQYFNFVGNHGKKHTSVDNPPINKCCDSQKKRKRLSRTVYTADQLEALNIAYKTKKYLNLQERATLAVSLNLSQTQVKIWFQNKRSKERKISQQVKKLDEVEPPLEESSSNSTINTKDEDCGQLEIQVGSEFDQYGFRTQVTKSTDTGCNYSYLPSLTGLEQQHDGSQSQIESTFYRDMIKSDYEPTNI